VREPYRVVLTKTARRGLDRLPDKVRPGLIDFLRGALADNPQRLGAQLTREPFLGMWSARYGKLYRIRYDINEESRTVLVLDIDTRGRAYRPD
jgi:mRNA interferase RelE/StbE